MHQITGNAKPSVDPCVVAIPHPRIKFQAGAQASENVGQSRKALFYFSNPKLMNQ
ncbi:hypothetical protein [Enterocloster phage PMBT24]|uniref:Uncharacterized protein n=1 Tax=Enterocloster phage PMBT24 TaxID=3025413 RepID=A0AAT9TSN0_9CAUD|nr:hypothetical protein [Enterocloster phage PMBT24]